MQCFLKPHHHRVDGFPAMEPAPVLCLTGLLTYIVAWWPITVEMFRNHRALGYLAFMAPIFTTLYAVIHLEELQRWFYTQIAGAALIGIGIWLETPPTT